MAAQQSMWHVNDVVAYDVMRELSGGLQARLLDLARDGDRSAHAELLEVRRTTTAVDGYDRAAVDSCTRQLRLRDAELALAASGAS
ncbi:hypothetical protein IWX81_001699 [Salinibacterium sp. CAN_S4]|uniref:hypothetical protein n=1 Tax=Salinibacterium sp. CAN_S4 TaxID=2787727 RepID=UPI0018EF4142